MGGIIIGMKILLNIKDKIDLKKCMVTYLVVYCVIITLLCSIKGPLRWGEFDDYTLPVASLLNDHNFSITDDDIAYYKVLFPEVATEIESYSLSGYMTRDGDGMLTWYFPTYAILSIPYVLILTFLDLPASYAFSYLNITTVMLMLVMAYKTLRFGNKRKFAVIIALSIAPVWFYFPWTLAESVIYAFLGMAMIAWYNGRTKCAALFLSLAGTLNITVMVTGFVMIFEYFFNLFQQKKETETFWQFVKANFIKTVQYGCCYVPGIIPVIYNLYHVGNINLTASYSSFTQGRETTWQRFISYFLDMNYGYLPYYGFLLVAAVVILIGAARKKHWKYIAFTVSFLSNVVLYSVMTHINCGYTGIARYSSWCSVILVCAVVFYYDEIITKKAIRSTVELLVSVNMIWLVLVMNYYGLYASSNTWGTGMMPIAKTVLEYCPSLYNPLGSSFCAGVNNIIGGYDYKTPIVYTDSNGHVRKILAVSEDREYLSQRYALSNNDSQWFEDQLNKLDEKERYISVPNKYHLVKNSKYYDGLALYFQQDSYNAEDYVLSGMYAPESWGTWSSGRVALSMDFSDIEANIIIGNIVCGTYNQSQHVRIYVNEKCVFDEIVLKDNGITFEFPNPRGLAEIRIDVITAKDIVPTDGRILGLSIGSIRFEGN